MKKYSVLSLSLLLSVSLIAMDIPVQQISMAQMIEDFANRPSLSGLAEKSESATSTSTDEIEKIERGQQLKGMAENAAERIFNTSAQEAKEVATSFDVPAAKNMQELAQHQEKRAEGLAALVQINDAQALMTDYESDTEKGLSVENIHLYRLGKRFDLLEETLRDAQPHLVSWYKNLDAEPAKELSTLSKTLRAETNRAEIWIRQFGKDAKTLSSFKLLCETLKSLHKTCGKLADTLTTDDIKKVKNDIRHPALQFMKGSDALEQLLR